MKKLVVTTIILFMGLCQGCISMKVAVNPRIQLPQNENVKNQIRQEVYVLDKQTLNKGKDFGKWTKKTGSREVAEYQGEEFILLDGQDIEKRKHRLPAWSLSKFALSTLVGVLVGEGLIQHSTPLGDVLDLPEDDYPHLSEITLQNLLQHLSGLKGGVRRSHIASAIRPDLRKWIRKSKSRYRPGTVYVYNSREFQIIVEIIEAVTGKDVTEVFEEKLARPLNWGSYGWKTDRKGQVIGSFGLHASAADLAKLGVLYVQDGKWNGRQILPKSWVEKALSFSEEPTKYPELSIAHLIKEPFCGCYYAVGLGNQYVAIFPEQQVVIVRLGKLIFRHSEKMKADLRKIAIQTIKIIEQQETKSRR